jgi:hypothetical protein
VAHEAWLLAIGWVIGYGTIRAAGKGGLFVQILSALSGLASPLLGIVFAAL